MRVEFGFSLPSSLPVLFHCDMRQGLLLPCTWIIANIGRGLLLNSQDGVQGPVLCRHLCTLNGPRRTHTSGLGCLGMSLPPLSPEHSADPLDPRRREERPPI